MMLTNKVNRPLTKAEDVALQKVALILESAFGIPMFRTTVNADSENDKEVFGISFAFDMRKDQTN